jgi:hypothetical protein
MAKRQIEQTIEDFAEDLGRLLGTARAKAENWLGQRQSVAKELADIRDTASDLLAKLGGAAAESARRARVAAAEAAAPRQRSERRRKPGRPKGFKMSAEARQKMREAWARRKARAKAK